KSPYYFDKSWAAQYWREFASSRQSRYHSYVIWRRAPFTGMTINIDEDGLRRTPGAVCRSDSYKIFAFGGSTMWGTGSPDWGTLPAYLQTAFENLDKRPICVVNFGESAFVSTQSVITLEARLQLGDVPDLAIFYDGVNDIFAAYQSGRTTVHENFESISHKFETDRVEPPSLFTQLFKSSGLHRVSTALANALTGGAPSPKLMTYETLGVDRGMLTEAILRTYLGNYTIVDALSQKYGFTYVFFWPPHILAGKKILTPDEEALKRNLEPALARLYQSVYQTIEPLAP